MTRPIVWTVAGSDCGGGAGVQADLKTMNSLGAHSCSVITALTAQNTQGVRQVELTSSAMLQAQLDALSTDLPPAAIKLGMLGDEACIRTVAESLRILDAFVVCDPVMVSTSGHDLLEETAIEALKTELFSLVDLLTPNLHEAERLTGQRIKNVRDMENAARILLRLGARSVLIKGGHFEGPFSQDYWTDGLTRWWLTSPRRDTRHTHGTGCTLSAAIAACIGLGFELPDALVIAKAYVNQGFRLAPQLGQGNGPLAHAGWPETHEDMPWLSPMAETGQNRPLFPDCGPERLGLYPIVDRFTWLEKLLSLGVSTIQLRIKDLEDEELEREIAQASAYARQFGCRLFINDYWRLAIKYGVYGVHLGQEDLETADLAAIQNAGLRLGVSTHCYQEVARALAVRPSYIAIGPVFHTTTKTMRFVPQGLDSVRRWRRTLPCPLVAIAGIFLENAAEVLETGVDGLAVVRDISQAENWPERVNQWLALFGDQVMKNRQAPV